MFRRQESRQIRIWRQEALKRVWCLHPAPFVTQNKTNSNPENKYKGGPFSGLAHDDYFDGVFWEISYSLKNYFYSHFWVSPTCQLLSVCLVCLVGHPRAGLSLSTKEPEDIWAGREIGGTLASHLGPCGSHRSPYGILCWPSSPAELGASCALWLPISQSAELENSICCLDG